MALPKLKAKGLSVFKVFYSLTAFIIFSPITFYWVLGLILTPAFIKSFNADGHGWIMGISFMLLSGFALLCFLILNLKVFAEKLFISQIPKVVNIGVGIGCLLCTPVIISYGLGLIPILLVACLYYIAYHNSLMTEAGVPTPTSQNHPPQEQV